MFTSDVDAQNGGPGLRAQEVLKPLLLRRTKDAELVRFRWSCFATEVLMILGYVGRRAYPAAAGETHRDCSSRVL